MARGFRAIARSNRLELAAAGATKDIAAGARIAAALVFLPVMLAGCALSFPIAPLFHPGAGDDTTGKIPEASLSSMLDAEDWRRAKAALATALDPQGNGSLVGWDNPDSGAKGSFTPVGKPYPLDAKICRAFLAEVSRKDGAQTLQGTACSDRSGAWSIAEAKPWKKI